jgi:hypothetical protein
VRVTGYVILTEITQLRCSRAAAAAPVPSSACPSRHLAMHQRRDHMLEHDAIRDAPAMAAQGVRWRDGGMEGQQGRELVPEGLQQTCWDDRHGHLRRSQGGSTPVIREPRAGPRVTLSQRRLLSVALSLLDSLRL